MILADNYFNGNKILKIYKHGGHLYLTVLEITQGALQEANLMLPGKM